MLSLQKERFFRKDDKIRFNRRELISILEISSSTFALESNNTALTTVQLITSRITSRCVTHCWQLRSWDSNEFAHRVPFHSFAKSSGVACEQKRKELYRSFRGIGAFGIKSVRPFTRSSGCYSVSRLCRCPMRLSPSSFPPLLSPNLSYRLIVHSQIYLPSSSATKKVLKRTNMEWLILTLIIIAMFLNMFFSVIIKSRKSIYFSLQSILIPLRNKMWKIK